MLRISKTRALLLFLLCATLISSGSSQSNDKTKANDNDRLELGNEEDRHLNLELIAPDIDLNVKTDGESHEVNQYPAASDEESYSDDESVSEEEENEGQQEVLDGQSTAQVNAKIQSEVSTENRGNSQSFKSSPKTLRHRHRKSHELKASRGQEARALMSKGSSSSKSSGKGKGKGASSSRSGSGRCSRGFLDSDIEPKPFRNCIPPPPGLSCSGSSKSKSKSKGKGKGKGSRRRHRRSGSRSSSRRELRGRGNGKGNGNGNGRSRSKLPWCPIPTESPTFLPTITPLPTVTPFPTFTPVPTFTPLPTITGQPAGPSLQPTASSAPSRSAAPSMNPTRSNAPSRSEAPSNAPSVFSSGPTTQIVESRLGYGFFPGTTVRQPTQQEVNGLVAQTNLFYSDLFRALYPSTFVSFTMTNIAESFQANRNLPYIIDFDANVRFNTASGQTPSQAQLFDNMDDANLQDYIQLYVWESEPVGTSIFFDTQSVSFGAKGQNIT